MTDTSSSSTPPVTETDVDLGDGHVLHVYDTGDPDDPGDVEALGIEPLVVVWHHGTPNIGAPPRPLFAAAARLGIRWVSYDRPGYGGSTSRPGRDIASAARDVEAVVDHLGVGSFAVMGYSGGGTHALAPAALLGDRVRGVVSVSGVAPFGAPGLDWFGGMAPGGEASLRAAAAGREVKEAHEAAVALAPEGEIDVGFVEADETAFSGPWGWLGSVGRPAMDAGPAALIDDDLAYVSDWGCAPGDVAAPTLVVHGGADRIVPVAHGEWLASALPDADLWIQPLDGHVSVLSTAGDALAWLARAARSS
ncbi:alpha/beta fold hydrolase [Terracoccus sp. 273MFTsu3.1]|uniref:alpha/beta fold hydrolase n=1 Tax=Terracoccus sp. 273MFTsu3.1 TaxID=1172188 RepID=UPI00036BD3E6|nr:alpha/beta hydrolase [Terracoccus sp. 273MFTsu3.1]